MLVRVMINGAKGRMGQVAVTALASLPGFAIVAELGRTDHLAQRIRQDQPDIVLDFTTSDTVYRHAEIILTEGVRPLIGATGLTRPQISYLQQIAAAQQIGGIIAPNFSLGALLMMRFAKMAARYFPRVDIIEMHHEHKKDTPSGTALLTAEIINEAGLAQSSIPSAQGTGLACGGVNIHSLRMPGLIANQQVLFGGPGETLAIDHRVQDRSVFIPGIRLACEKLMGLDQLIYGLEQLLD